MTRPIIFSSSLLLSSLGFFPVASIATVAANGYVTTGPISITTTGSLVVNGFDVTTISGGQFDFSLNQASDNSTLPNIVVQNNSYYGVASFGYAADNASGGWTWSNLANDQFVSTHNEVTAANRHAGGGGYLEYSFTVSGTGNLEVALPYENGIFASDAYGRVFADASLSVSGPNVYPTIVDRSFLDMTMNGNYSETSSGVLHYSAFYDSLDPNMPIYPNGQIPVAISFNTYAGSTIVNAVPEMETWLMMLVGFSGIAWKMRRRHRAS